MLYEGYKTVYDRYFEDTIKNGIIMMDKASITVTESRLASPSSSSLDYYHLI